MKSRLVKMILVGADKVGKTAIRERYLVEKFNALYTPTIGIDVEIKGFEKQNKSLKFQIWDTSGNERFATINKNYYRICEYFIVVVEAHHPEIYDYCNKWIQSIQQDAMDYYKDNIIIVIHNTQESNQAVLDAAEANAARFVYFPICHVNAKANTGIDNLFNKVILNRVIELEVAEEKNALLSASPAINTIDAEIDLLFSQYLNPLKYFFIHHWKRMTAVRDTLKKLPSNANKLILIDNQLDLLEGSAKSSPPPFEEKFIDHRWTHKVDKDASKNFDASGAYQTLFAVRAKLDSAESREKKTSGVSMNHS